MPYAVSVFPLYSQKTGDLCAYMEGELLGPAMRIAGEHAERWLEAPRELPEGEEEPRVVGFDVTVEIRN